MRGCAAIPTNHAFATLWAFEGPGGYHVHAEGEDDQGHGHH